MGCTMVLEEGERVKGGMGPLSFSRIKVYIIIIMGHLKIRLKISVRDSLDKVFTAFLHAGKGRDLPARRL
ncbi:hypothetical protein [uncultured Desulfovibrio sp.]|uniref:hypothetical protein n=2 Tax=uncultured Desulfovibrio sp. TaxID=167968 RepID=UPI00272A5C09|nr:hypothetical protein [uncultured Desulfovibrio sp.]